MFPHLLLCAGTFNQKQNFKNKKPRKTDRNPLWGLFREKPREKLLCMCCISWLVEAGFVEKDRARKTTTPHTSHPTPASNIASPFRKNTRVTKVFSRLFNE